LFFTEEGFEMEWANDGKEALEKLKAFKPDFAVT